MEKKEDSFATHCHGKHDVSGIYQNNCQWQPPTCVRYWLGIPRGLRGCLDTNKMSLQQAELVLQKLFLSRESDAAAVARKSLAQS